MRPSGAAAAVSVKFVSSVHSGSRSVAIESARREAPERSELLKTGRGEGTSSPHPASFSPFHPFRDGLVLLVHS